MNNQERAKQFFLLGEQYSETAQLLLDILIHNGNSNCGIGSTMEESVLEMEKNSLKSDLYLFIPAIFNCLQSTELFIKGLLLQIIIGLITGLVYYLSISYIIKSKELLYLLSLLKKNK